MNEKQLFEWFLDPAFRPETTPELARRFHAEQGEAFSQLLKAIARLEQDGRIGKNKREQYQTIERLNLLRGIIDLKSQGYGFVTPEGQEKGALDLYVAKENTLDAMNKDLVLARITRRTSPTKIEGVVVRILKRDLEFIVGEYFQGAIFPRKAKGDILFKVPAKYRAGLTEHTLVKAEILKYHPGNILDCKVVETLGSAFEPDAEMKELIASHGVEVDFPSAVLSAVKAIPDHVLDSERAGRVDLRQAMIFTIDGDDTKDIDDAVSLELLPSGNYRLGVHIADVSHYVKEGSTLDQNAFSRGTSVYLADRVVPMLPKELSNGICSLNPVVDRLAMTAEMEISPSGAFVKTKFYPSVIHSRHQMTYTNVNLILAGDPSMNERYSDIAENLKLMANLQEILYQKRTSEGSINFETIEPRLLFDEFGNVKDIVIRNRGVAERLIEEFMLMANQAVAIRFTKQNLPALYRIHAKPDEDRVASVFQLAKEIGYVKKLPQVFDPKHLQELLAKVEDTEYEKVVNMMLLRAMAKAKYAPDNVGHYGLGFPDYTHFTSPIRRYPDLIVHRLMRVYFFHGQIDEATQNHYDALLYDIGIQTSKTERTAMMLEREVMDRKKAEYMSPFVGQVFTGIVSTLTRFGMFVELPNTVEGLVHISTFKEAIEFREESMTYLGITTRTVYNIGKIVKVKLVKTNPLQGQIDFELA